MNGKFFKCDCSSEGIWVEHDIHFGTEIALFIREPHSRSWGNRIKLAWACLKGKPYADNVLLNNQSLMDLVDHLVEIQNCNHKEENYRERVDSIIQTMCCGTCGSAADAIIEYMKLPDISEDHCKRIISEFLKGQ